MEFKHTSVLLQETIEQLKIRPDGIYVDGTLGGGGHAYEVLSRLSKHGRLIGIDQDADAIRAASKRLEPFQDQVRIVRSNYVDMRMQLKNLGIEKVDGIILDLGVSSFQLDSPARGFTYRVEDAPLDMRMDDRQKLTAKDIVNEYSEKELFRIIRDFGEDKFAKNIAKHIVNTRREKEILTTGELCAVIRAAIPMKVQKSGGHPAKRTFQAIRIELNRELDVLRNSLDDMIDLLKDGGRICVITFHSLEDRIVKTVFKKNEHPCICPPDFPVCVCGRISKGTAVRRPIVPSEEELKNNKRSKSAKLRIFERKEQ
ncbi:Ribosomal RNA small subunit methyltransferase H [Eubacterium plexicaudatum ASF492]|uniref:Ribosomal RNA small subunit methyltransferase H n=1 Tax=Eubacterium plexicaudatum ASF492 TaxID=1235802 RepID=N2B7K2_9FIRM|nr:Ribosomal RNA small subunit methyltransferase H [Eubacterium plexicaudatum ASF492]